MKVPKKSAHGRVVALALTWDGSRWPVRSLPPAARAFLGRRAGRSPSAAVLGQRLAGGEIRELRICWVPRLQGGDNVLAAPFVTPDGLRVRFRAARSRRIGDLLGVVYRPLARGPVRSAR
jgi:hypothetical protein